MRKINLFAVMTAVVATTFTACTNTEDVAMPEQKVLDFSVFANKNTRAAEDAGSLKTDGKAFGVWGYSTFGTPPTATTTTVFDNQEVKYNGTTSAWEYSPLKFWDSRSSYEFYAYYPRQANGVTIDADKKITVTDFTVASTVADHVDLMLAGKVERAVGEAINTVNFNFNHLLSNINLSFKKHAQIENTMVTLKSVKIYGMSKKGDFVQSLSDSHAGVWTPSTTDMVALTDAEELANDNELANSAAIVTFNDMLFIPQGTNTLKVDVNYILGDVVTGQPFFRTLDLSNTATSTNPATWAQNQKIAYNFTINADVIEFGDPTVVDWDTNQDVEVPTIE